MKVTLLQQEILWADKAGNLDKFGKIIAKLKGQTDLVVLPEMFTTGFCVDRLDLAEDMNGTTVQLLKFWSAAFNLAVTGSFIAREDDKYYNRAFLVLPDGQIHTADKRHLFSVGSENDHFTSGNSMLIASWKGFNICVLICYDLRFPVWSRNKDLKYDLLIYTANFPSSRIEDWDVLLKARAIENQSYVIGLNRTGKDGSGLDHNGHSVLLDYRGKELANFAENESGQRTELVDIEILRKYRQRFPFWRDAD